MLALLARLAPTLRANGIGALTATPRATSGILRPVAQSADPGRLRALLELLGDERAPVREAAASALSAEAPGARLLRSMVEEIEDAALRARARAGLEALRTRALEGELERLVANGADLEEGAFLLARFEYPDLDVAAYRAALDGMAQELRGRLESARSEAVACGLLRKFLHDERGFRGDVEHYGDPENVFLNRVLDRRVGIPTSLSCVYLLLARRVGVALEPVNLPLHFLVRWKDERGETFIDAFARGRFLTRDDCREFLREAGIRARPEHLVRATDRAVLARLARCLVASFRQRGALLPARLYERCLEIVGG